jgi:PAS domain S-box-containing protein
LPSSGIIPLTVSPENAKRRVKLRFYGMAIAGGLTAAALGAIGLVVWALPWLAYLAHTPWLLILVLPETAVSLCLLGSSIYLFARYPNEVRFQMGITCAGGLVGILTLLDLHASVIGTPPPVHTFFLHHFRWILGNFQPAAWTEVSLLVSSCSVMLLPITAARRYHRLSDWIGYAASFLFLAHAAILLSYFYGTPVPVDSAWQLPSLTSNIACMALALSLIGILGPRQFPLHPLLGDSVRARLLRTFLPVAVAAVLVQSLLQHTIFNAVNPVVSVTLTSFVSTVIAGFLVVRSAQDVSYQIEQAVRESEQRFGILVDSLEDYAIFMLDPEGRVVTWNAGAEGIIGYRSEEIMGEDYACFYTLEDAAQGKSVESLRRAVMYGSYIDQGWRVRKDGSRFWADVTITPLLDEAGHLEGYANVTRDITERKTAEEALRQKTAFVQMLQMVSSAANETSSLEQALHICLEQVCQQTGWPIGHSLLVSPSTGLLESVNWHITDEQRYHRFQDQAIGHGVDSGEGLPGRVMATGNSAWIRDMAKDPRYPYGRAAEKAGLQGGYAFPVKVGNEVVAVLEFFSEEVAEPNLPLIDVMGHIGTQLGRVVERSRAEAALRESEMRFRSVAQSANDAIVSCNAYGLIIAWNKGARAIFGYAEEEMLGNALTLIVPDCMRILSTDNHELMLSGPHSPFGRTIEAVGRNKMGEEFPIELSVADWRIGEDVFFTAIIRNILKRKEAEAHISASLLEKEVLLKEIHHRVKNNLQIISSLLRLQSQKVTDSRTLDMFRESQNRVQSMALIHEYLYQSRDMARINFSEYIRKLTAHLLRSYGVTPGGVRLNVDVDETPLDLDTAIPCGLIITELVSNSLKHAFPAQAEGHIDVRFHTPDEGKHYALTVKDDGKGIPPGLNLDKTESLGLRLVNTLTQQLKGHIQVENHIGTQITITFEMS